MRTSCSLPVEAEQSVDILEEALAAIDDASNPPPQQVDELERTKKAETLEQMKVMADIKRWLQSREKGLVYRSADQGGESSSLRAARVPSFSTCLASAIAVSVPALRF